MENNEVSKGQLIKGPSSKVRQLRHSYTYTSKFGTRAKVAGEYKF